MSLEAGKRLGPYEITSPIGAGGMGEVYKAKDTRLDRTVAIKVLPEHLAEDAERKQRFEREAKVISQLNHPHICTLYDVRLRQGYGGQVGDVDDMDYMVMEYIDGETLAERLKKGALPLEQAVEYGKQIADGLDKAHRAGIVHRDLKPANVMLTPSGVKILDFGLATTVLTEAVDGGSDAPTQQKELTKEHSVIGTLQYMAPEQLEGKPADARADVWAYGLLVSEMVTGRKVFEGASQASLIGAILHTEPARLSALEPQTPASLDWAVQRCLAKDPDDRWQSIRDLLAELKRPAPSQSAGAASTRPLRSTALALLAAGATLGAVAAWMLGPTVDAPPRPSRFVMGTPVDAPVRTSSTRKDIAISPDGSTIVYASQDGLFVRKLSDLDATPIRGGERGVGPFFSPDGEWVGFLVAERNELRKVPVSGGASITICQTTGAFRGATWGADDTIVFFGSGFGLQRVSASGGAPIDLTDDPNHESPTFLPSGNTIVFSTGPAVEKRLATLSLETGAMTELGVAGNDPMYVASGHLLFVSHGTVQGARFDPARPTVLGPQRPVLENVSVTSASGIGVVAAAQNGTLVYKSGGETARALVWVDRSGREEPLPLPERQYHWSRVAPDGKRIAVHIDQGASADVWIADAGQGTLTRLTTDSAPDRFPVWTPDGSRVVFASARNGALGLYSTIVDGRGLVEPLVTNDAWHGVDPYSWTPDGKILIFSYLTAESSWDLGRLSVEGEPEWTPVLEAGRAQGQPAISPDGQWLAYLSTESGPSQIFAERFPELGDRLQISIDGGYEPVWSPDGGELFYRTDTPRELMSVDISTEPTLKAGEPVTLFRDIYFRGGDRSYDIAPDGERFLMLKDTSSGDNDIVVVLDWFEELERLVPTDD